MPTPRDRITPTRDTLRGHELGFAFSGRFAPAPPRQRSARGAGISAKKLPDLRFESERIADPSTAETEAPTDTATR
jgi:hypothetical protein